MKKLLFLLFGLISIESFAQSFIPNTPTLDLKSYILIEPNTNTVIASFNEDAPIEPASMTKVMSSYVIADQIANDFLSLDDNVLVSEKAWRMEGSKMFIEQGKRVSVLDLLKGIIIQSGNDATVALAEYVGGTEDGFVDLMNSYAASMGLSNTLFQNSTGLPDGNHFSSAKDLATMTSLLINNFPETLIQVCSNELLYNDAIEFTKKLGEKGTKYELQVWDDLWHAWHFFPIKESSDALKKIVNFITSDSYSSPK